MASETTSKVRLVRCPKCRQVLPEIPDIPVYRCGSCNTILQAKHRKANVASTSSSVQETETVQADNLVHLSEDGEASSSTPSQEAVPSSPESHLNRNISIDSHCEKHDENLTIEGPENDHAERDQTTSSGSDKLDERSNEGQLNGSGQLQMKSLEYCNVQEPGVSTELHHEIDESMLVGEVNEKVLQEGGADSEEVETNSKIDSNLGDSSNIDNTPVTRNNNLPLMTCAAAGEDISSDNVFSSPNEYLELEQPKTSERYTRVRSIDTSATTGFATPSSEFSGPLCLSKSTTRSSHAYDGSISSYDGIDDHFAGQKIHSFKKGYNAAANFVPGERYRREKLPAEGMMNGTSGMQDRARNAYMSSDLSNKEHYAEEKYSKWHQGELLEPVMHHYPPRNQPRLGRDDYQSHVPFSQRASLRGYESAGPSQELHDEFPSDSAFHPLEKAELSEQESMKLLRMVCELQDQISKTHLQNGKPDGRRTSIDVSRRKQQFPTYYSHEPPEEENFYPRYHGRSGHRSSWSQESRFSRIPFSGGAINTRHDTDSSCSCCHPQARQRSEQLFPPTFRRSQGFTRASLSHSYYNSYSSCPTTPQRYMESDFSIWSHETKSDDQRYRDHELKRYLREKHHSLRRHLRPTAGGAPFVSCYHCFKPLQLPADFLLFKRKCHKVKCGACSKILKFSLQKGVHIVPYELVAEEPPPSVVGDSSDAINVRLENSASCSHSCVQAETSYSEDYGYSYSFCKSCSTDGDLMEQRRDFILRRSQNKDKNSMEAFDSAGPSSLSRGEKVPSEIEEVRPRGGNSPLHRLMGYSSPSQVIRGVVVPSISRTSTARFGRSP